MKTPPNPVLSHAQPDGMTTPKRRHECRNQSSAEFHPTAKRPQPRNCGVLEGQRIRPDTPSANPDAVGRSPRSRWPPSTRRLLRRRESLSIPRRSSNGHQSLNRGLGDPARAVQFMKCLSQGSEAVRDAAPVPINLALGIYAIPLPNESVGRGTPCLKPSQSIYLVMDASNPLSHSMLSKDDGQRSGIKSFGPLDSRLFLQNRQYFGELRITLQLDVELIPRSHLPRIRIP